MSHSGFEPETPGLKVQCSTYWASDPQQRKLLYDIKIKMSTVYLKKTQKNYYFENLYKNIGGPFLFIKSSSKSQVQVLWFKLFYNLL